MQAGSAGYAHAILPKGAMGPMQIMPKTWADLRQRYGFGIDPCDVRDNSVAGAAYPQELFEFAGWRLDVSRRELRSPANALVDLRAAEFDMLLALVDPSISHLIPLLSGSRERNYVEVSDT